MQVWVSKLDVHEFSAAVYQTKTEPSATRRQNTPAAHNLIFARHIQPAEQQAAHINQEKLVPAAPEDQNSPMKSYPNTVKASLLLRLGKIQQAATHNSGHCNQEPLAFIS